MELLVSSTLAAAAAVALVALSFPVSLRRMKTGVVAGDGGDAALQRLVRAQGNFIEYVPLALVVFALAELAGASAHLLGAMGVVLVVGRAAHALGMLRGSTPLRAIGMVSTYTALLVTAGALAVAVYG